MQGGKPAIQFIQMKSEENKNVFEPIGQACSGPTNVSLDQVQFVVGDLNGDG